MDNILITSAGRRVSLVKAFKTELARIYPAASVFVTDYSPSLSAAAQIADQSFRTPLINESDYIDSLLSICLEKEVGLLIPTLDSELLILSKNKLLFESNGIIVIVSNEEFVNICEHKLRTHQLFQTLNLDVAKCYDKDCYNIPLYIKPINGSSSIDNYIVKSEDQISKYHLKTDSLHFFEYLDHDIYDEYTCDLYYDKKGFLKCVIPRIRIQTRGGEVTKSITKNGAVKEFVDKNFSNLKGAKGCITLQLFYNKEENIFKGIELNARFGGGFPLSYLAGGNYPKWIIEEYLLNKEIAYYDGWEANMLMLRYDDEVLLRNYDK
jgi:carbamoyl-phosphate synthase large subunit